MQIKKKYYFYLLFFVAFITILVLFLLGTNFLYKKNIYKKGIECYQNKNWICVIKNYENLDYKDSQFLLSKAKYENHLTTAKSYLDKNLKILAQIEYQKALSFQPNNKDLKEKIKNLDFLIEEDVKREAIEQKQQEERQKEQLIKSKISDTAIYPIPTKFGEGYDETIKKYGTNTINRINKLAPKAAKLVAANPRCTRVMQVDVADDKSTKNSITFFVDCGSINDIRNIERFYVSEQQIKSNEKPKSVKEQSENISDVQYILHCEAEIKSRLNFPSKYKTNAFKNNVSKSTLGTTTTIYFKAKNGFNLETSNVGTCYYEGRKLTDINIQEKM